MRIFFLTLRHENLVSFQEVNPENFMPLKSSVARSFLCQICPYSVFTNSPKSSVKYFYECMDPTAAHLGGNSLDQFISPEYGKLVYLQT